MRYSVSRCVLTQPTHGSPASPTEPEAMEEAKAAAYYDELNRKGEGARRFKQGLGFSSSDPDPASFPSKPTTSSSSLLSGFVRAGATPSPAQLPNPTKPPPPPEPSSRQRRRFRSPSPSPSPSRPRPRSRSPSRSRRRRSRSRDRGDRRASRRRSRSRSWSRSPSRRSGRSSHFEGRRDRHGDRRRDDGGGGRESSKGRGGRDAGKVDYSRLIEGYDRMVGRVLLILFHNLILLYNCVASLLVFAE